MRETISDRLIRYYNVKFKVEDITKTLKKVILISDEKRMFHYIDLKSSNTVGGAMENLATSYCVDKNIDVKESKIDK